MDNEKGHILVVDDSEENRAVLARRLSLMGHTVELAEDGRQALQVLSRQSFDAILLDVMMPEMDGYQVLEYLKADNDLRHIPVIMITAVDAIESVIKCVQMGAEDYLPKPFNKELLQARLNTSLAKKRWRDQEAALLSQIQKEKMRSDELLHVILPPTVVEELKKTDEVKPRRYENVAVLFCDIVGFTAYCDKNEPEEVVSHLQELTVAFENIALEFKVQKIKTIGDAFMAAAGLMEPLPNPVLNCVSCGLEMISTSIALPAGWQIRVGVHCGPVIAGVIGHRQYLFDLWGDTVNTAQRVESHGAVNTVNVSLAAWDQIFHLCRGDSLGTIQVKGKGEMEIFRVDGLIA